MGVRHGFRGTVHEALRHRGEVSEISRERERYTLGRGGLHRPRYRNKRDHEDGCAHRSGDERTLARSGAARQGAQEEADEGEGGEEETCLLEEHDDEPLRTGGGRDSAE